MAGQGEEHLVECRLLHAHLTQADARLPQCDEQLGDPIGVVQRNGDAPGLGRRRRPGAQYALDRDRRVAEVGGVGEPEVKAGFADRRLQVVGGAFSDDPPVIDDRDAVGELVGLVEVLRGEQHRRAGGHEPPDRRPHLGTGAGVEPGGGLIEEDEGRLRDEARGEVEASPHAAGVLRDRLLRGIREPELLEELGRLALRVAATEAQEAREQHEVLDARERLVDGCLLAGEPDQLSHDLRLSHDVVAEDARTARVGLREGGEHRDRRRLACAVRPEHAVYGAGGDAEVDAVDRARGAEGLHETVGLDGPAGVSGCHDRVLRVVRAGR